MQIEWIEQDPNSLPGKPQFQERRIVSRMADEARLSGEGAPRLQNDPCGSRAAAKSQRCDVSNQ